MIRDTWKPFVCKSRGYSFWYIQFPTCTMRELYATQAEAFTHALEIARRQRR